jgi:hypothetical protein
MATGYPNRVFPHVALHIGEHALITEFWRVHANHHEAFFCISLMPSFDVGFNVAAVVTAESPKLHQNYVVSELGDPRGSELSQLCPRIPGAGIPTPPATVENIPPDDKKMIAGLRSAAIFFLMRVMSFPCASLLQPAWSLNGTRSAHQSEKHGYLSCSTYTQRH